ncbi:hypothetical protein B0H11DRAFT_1907139 [Mycena galericulata]|nr:hypothetical protein B0H11DRAFT_1907139 [Mycena galericulata]
MARGAMPPASALFDDGVALEESPARVSQGGARSQPSPSLEGEYDFASNGDILRGPFPGDDDYNPDAAASHLAFPDPNATADLSTPGIATLEDEPETDYDFTDLTGRSGEYFDYDEDEPQEQDEQVGGGWRYDLRQTITPSPNAERVGLQAQKRRQESYQAQAEATEGEGNEGPVSPVPAKRRNEGPVSPIPAKRRNEGSVSAAPAKRRTKGTNAAAAPSNAAHLPRPATAANAVAPSAATPLPSAAAPLPRSAAAAARRGPKQPLYDSAAAAAAPHVSANPTAPKDAAAPVANPFQTGPTTIPQQGAGTLTVQPRRQARSETPAPRQHAVVPPTLAGPTPMRASSLQPSAKRAATPAQDYTPIPPDQFRGSLPEYLSQGGYTTNEMPPPPPNWDASRRRTPLPLDHPQPKVESVDAQTPNMDGSDAEEDPNDGEEDAAPTGGRPLRAQREALDRGFALVRERLVQCASEAGVSYSAALKQFYQEEHTGLRPGRNTWNLYQRFANYDDKNRLRERRRLNPSYTSASPVPSLSNPELSRAYKAFVDARGGEEKADETLSIFFQMGGAADDTLQARNRRFKAAVKAFERMNERNRVDDFFACIFFVGGHTNEDDKLARVIGIPGIAEAIYNGLATREDEILGIARTAAATVMINEQAQIRRSMRAAPAATSTPPLRRGVPPSTAATSRAPTASSSAAHTVPTSEERPASLTTVDATGTAAGSLTADTTETAAQAAAARLPTQTPTLRRGAKSSTTAFPCEIQNNAQDTQDVRHVMSMASVEDLGEDIFNNNNGFSWTVMAGLLLEKNHRITGYPANVRLPSEASPMKGSGSWTRGERRYIRVALAARSTPGEGLRFERVAYQPGDRNFVILSHDYTLPPPPGNPDSAAVRAFWTTTAEPVHCTAGDNTTWEATYDLAEPATLLCPPPTQNEVKAGKKRADPAKKRKAAAVDEDESEERDEPEPEDETSPPPAKRMRGPNPETKTQVGGGREPASPSSPRRVNITHARRVQKEFPKTPPRTGREAPLQGNVRFASNGGPGDDDDDSDDDKPIARSRPRRRYDTPHAEDAPARRAPRHKHGNPDDGDSEYSEASGAESVAEDVPPRQTRSRAANQAATKPAAAKSAAAKSAAAKPAKPAAAILRFDGVELTTPPSKRPKPNTTAKQPSAGSSRPGMSRPAPSHNPPPGTSRRMTGERPHNPPPPAPVAGFALPPEFAGMDPAQVEAMIMAAAAVLRRAPPPGA